MQLHQAQKQIVADLHRFRILVCGRKFGKTTLASEEITGCSISGKERRVLYLAPTLEDSRRLMWDRLKRKLKNVIIKSNDTRLELKVSTVAGGSSDIFLGSWQKVQDYRGDEFDFIIPDETQDYRDFWLGWHEALRPTLTPRMGGALFMGTPKGFNHLYDLFNLEVKDSDYKSFKFTTYDNPYIPIKEIEKAKNELSEDRFAQEYLADFRKTEGLVFKEFSRERHIFDGTTKLPRFIEEVGGVDFGFKHPAGVVSVKIDFDGRYWIFTEWYKTGRTESQIADYVVSCKFNRVFPDPENASAIEVLHQKGVNISEVKKGKDSVMSGINRIRDLFKQNRIFIHRSCVNLINEFETYSYPDLGEFEKKGDEKPIKSNDHLIDALRYVVFMTSLTKVEEIPEYKQPEYEPISDYEKPISLIGSDWEEPSINNKWMDPFNPSGRGF
jgi:PBSX family phage terminase large subunit